MQALNKLAERAATVHGLPAPQLPPKAEYASVRLQCAFIAPTLAPTAAHLPPPINVFRGGSAALDRLAPGSAALRSLEARRRQLAGTQFDGAEPTLDSQEFAAAVAELAQWDIERLQAALTHSAQQVCR